MTLVCLRYKSLWLKRVDLCLVCVFFLPMFICVYIAVVVFFLFLFLANSSCVICVVFAQIVFFFSFAICLISLCVFFITIPFDHHSFVTFVLTFPFAVVVSLLFRPIAKIDNLGEGEKKPYSSGQNEEQLAAQSISIQSKCTASL